VKVQSVVVPADSTEKKNALT